MGVFTFLKLYKWYQIAQHITKKPRLKTSFLWKAISFFRKITVEVEQERKETFKKQQWLHKTLKKCPLRVISYHTYIKKRKHVNNEFIFLLTKEIQTQFCICNLVPGNCHTCSNSEFIRSLIENAAYDYHTPKLNMTCVDACACDRTPFMDMPDLWSGPIENI